jgi:hypothetical protein
MAILCDIHQKKGLLLAGAFGPLDAELPKGSWAANGLDAGGVLLVGGVEVPYGLY